MVREATNAKRRPEMASSSCIGLIAFSAPIIGLAALRGLQASELQASELLDEERRTARPEVAR